MATVTVRVDAQLVESATTSGPSQDRSGEQQLEHWARIGREVETAPGVSHRDVNRVLAGNSSYDDLNDMEQAIVRATWEERMTSARASLNLEEEFTREGRRSWIVGDGTGAAASRPATTRQGATDRRESGKA